MLYNDSRVCVCVCVCVCFDSFQIHKHRNIVCHFVYRETERFIDNENKRMSYWHVNVISVAKQTFYVTKYIFRINNIQSFKNLRH